MYGEIRSRPTSDQVIFTSVTCGPDSPCPKDCPGLGDPNTCLLYTSDAAVACRPDSPRPKDCPGLGDPNTLKSFIYIFLNIFFKEFVFLFNFFLDIQFFFQTSGFGCGCGFAVAAFDP